MHKYFKDINYLIKEQSQVAELIVIEAKRLTNRVTGQENEIDYELLRTLTALVMKSLDIEKIKMDYEHREQLQKTKQQIAETLKRNKTANF